MKHLVLCLSVVTLAAMDRSLAANGNVSDDFYTAIRVNDLPYATGESLHALTKAGGLAPSDPSYQRGARFLLTTQRPDGSWRVVSRSPKFQTYFTTGFPYAGDQWISSWATGWATMALAQAIEPSSALAAR